MSELFSWTEKYRPSTVADCVLPRDLKTTMQSFVAQGDLPNMILAGGPGMGKTTTAMAMCRELEITPLFINGSSDGNIDTLRTTITDYVSSIGFDGKRRMVIIDEADYLNINSTQPAMRALMEEYARNAGFILTCNYPQRILAALHSRSSSFVFAIPSDEKKELMAQTFKRLMYIFKAENVTADKDLVTQVVKRFWPDMRKMINECQKAVVDGVLTPGVLGQQANVQYDELYIALKKRDYRSVRNWIGQNVDLDPPRFYRTIFEWAHEHVTDQTLPNVIVLTADYQYRHSMALDSQVHLAAYCLEIMTAAQYK